jgi:hypothetical protein
LKVKAMSIMAFRKWTAPFGALILCLIAGCQSLGGLFGGSPGQGPAAPPGVAKAGPSSPIPDAGQREQLAAMQAKGMMMTPNDQISLMSQKLAASEDDRKVLAAHLENVMAQLDEKDKALALATREVQEATAQIVRTRNDLQVWKKDALAMRDKVGNMEKEQRELLETIIKTLEKSLERDPAKMADPLGVEPLPLPRQQ